MTQQPYGSPHGPAPWTGLPYPQVVVTAHPSSTAHVVLAWVGAVLTAGYLLPWAVAATRNRSNTAAIALVNLFLGWSVLGWVVALVMAVGSEPGPVVHVSYPAAPYWPGPAAGPAGYGPPAPLPASVWSAPPAPAPALPPRDRRPEPTVIDPAGWAETQQLPPVRPTGYQPYDPPAYDSGDDHRR